MSEPLKPRIDFAEPLKEEPTFQSAANFQRSGVAYICACSYR